MHKTIIHLLLTLLSCLPSLASAATSIHVEWGYTPPSTPAVTGFKLYQEGNLACQTQNPNAIAMDCEVTLTAATTNFTLTATFSDSSESPHSAPFAFTGAADPSAPSPAPDSTLPTGPTPAATTGSKLFTFIWEAPANQATLQGYRFYLNNGLLCQSSNPADTTVACKADLINGLMTFTMTAVNADGTETNTSNGLTYSAEATTGTATLQAVVAATPLTGPAPLTVNFNAGSSTGAIASFQWDFGDGAIATGSSTSHAYTVAGTYTAKLTVTGTTGQTSITTTTVTASTATATATPPKAVLSSSTAAGPAPLTVSFDGSASTAAAGTTIASYGWSFGDGTTGTGATASHTFAAAGTYSTSLTVKDSNGLTSNANTPVVVTAASATANKAPTAVASATPLTGTAPLTVSFDASGSTDSDGTIASYSWNFGDGSTATGKTASHTYTTEASFSATLQVTDNAGAKGTATTSITVQAKPLPPALNIELGEIPVTSNWVRVPISGTFVNPVVIASPPGVNNADPCVVRLRNVNKTGFDIRLAEWNYQDGTHPTESITYLVMEKGRIALPDGSIVEAGTFTGTTSFKTLPYTAKFIKVPVVLTTIASANEADTISGRVKNIGLANFSYYFREQEKNTNTHVNETVNYLAWQPGKGTLGEVQFEVGTTAKAVTQAWYNATFGTAFKQTPLLLADMQTTSDTDPTALRVQQITATGFQVKAEEEKSKSTNVTHTAEIVGYLALNQAEEKALASFSWDFDSAEEANVIGFQILLNGSQICTTNNPSARQLDCEITKPVGPTAFTMQTVGKVGGDSVPSNTINYTP